MRHHRLQLVCSLLISVLSFISCQKDSDIDPNQPLIDQMKYVTDSIIEHTVVPGVVALVVDHNRGIDWLYAAGLADIPNNQALNGNHTFRIGSNTKTMVVTVLLQLVDEGRLSLDDKLSDYYPDYPRSENITIAMLCNMTTGIYNYSEDESWLYQFYTNPLKAWPPEELVEIGFSHDFHFNPGTDWRYSNTNTIILGMLIEKLTGNSLQAEIHSRIVSPLQLSNTGMLTSGSGLPGVHARGYYTEEGEEYVDVTEYFDVSWSWAAGSAYSTPRELQKYVEDMVGGSMLSGALQQKRLDDLIAISDITGYGLGILKRDTFFGHNGALPGFSSSMYHCNVNNCTIIIYFNCLSDLHSDFLFYRFRDILFGEG